VNEVPPTLGKKAFILPSSNIPVKSKVFKAFNITVSEILVAVAKAVVRAVYALPPFFILFIKP
jgi:hypothetical protein